ncbi:hypothetical protein F4804DRAFT_297934 [Jackrogersella minutella]|nr:hypothetical protein F4804DRAFT_297934 [Jackrogersella minutella]
MGLIYPLRTVPFSLLLVADVVLHSDIVRRPKIFQRCGISFQLPPALCTVRGAKVPLLLRPIRKVIRTLGKFNCTTASLSAE